MAAGRRPGVFMISLDFELYWGVRDKRTIEGYRENLLGVRRAVAEMLAAFAEQQIHVTWATVGFLFFRDAGELSGALPPVRPAYVEPQLCPYRYIASQTELEPVYHFAPELIARIRAHPGQEIATHTFSHYYCLERGQDIVSVREDLAAAVRVARASGVALRSLVFPRNQWNPEYLPVLQEFGIACFRATERSPFYEPTQERTQSRVNRAVRLLDAYVNLTGHHTYTLAECGAHLPFAIPASRFLRPYSPQLAILDPLRLRRITAAITHAATAGRVFHLWWHPHNFGRHTEANVAFLRRILAHVAKMRARYGMESLNMGELAARLDPAHATRS